MPSLPLAQQGQLVVRCWPSQRELVAEATDKAAAPLAFLVVGQLAERRPHARLAWPAPLPTGWEVRSREMPPTDSCVGARARVRPNGSGA